MGIAINFINRLFTLQTVLSQTGIPILANALRILNPWRESVSMRGQRHPAEAGALSRLHPTMSGQQASDTMAESARTTTM